MTTTAEEIVDGVERHRRGLLIALEVMAAHRRLEAHLGDSASVGCARSEAQLVESIILFRRLRDELEATLGDAHLAALGLPLNAPVRSGTLLVTLLDLLTLATMPDFPIDSIPWLVRQAARVGHQPLAIYFTTGSRGRIATDLPI